jgi:hypothetical protein
MPSPLVVWSCILQTDSMFNTLFLRSNVAELEDGHSETKCGRRGEGL